MGRKVSVVFATVLVILLLVIGLAIFYFNNSQQPQIPYKHPPMITQTFTLGNFPSVSQGSTFQINITITSLLDSELSLPFENLYIMAYNDGSADIPPGELFSYSLSENPLIIPANGTSTTTLTVKMASDVPIGKYLFYLKYGNSNITYVGGNSLIVNVDAANVVITDFSLNGYYNPVGVVWIDMFNLTYTNNGPVDVNNLTITFTTNSTFEMSRTIDVFEPVPNKNNNILSFMMGEPYSLGSIKANETKEFFGGIWNYLGDSSNVHGFAFTATLKSNNTLLDQEAIMIPPLI
jgi:hypothetical protein